MIQTFIDWIRSNGGFVSDKVSVINLPEEEGSRGVVCTDDIDKGFTFLKLPKNLLLNPSNSSNFQVHFRCKNNPNVSNWAPLIVSIILERHDPDSFWRPYLDTLPHKVDLPCEWPPEDQTYMKSSKIFKSIQRDFSKIERNISLLLEKAAFSLNSQDIWREYRQASSIISAYSFCDGKVTSMVPFADLLNHRTGFNNARLFFKRNYLVMRTIKACKRGEQLFNTYGELGNSELLLKYGFIDNGNPFTQIEISISELIKAANSINLKCRKSRIIAKLIRKRYCIFLNNHIHFARVCKDLFYFKDTNDIFSLLNHIADTQMKRHTPLGPSINDRQALAQKYLQDYSDQINFHHDKVIQKMTAKSRSTEKSNESYR